MTMMACCAAQEPRHDGHGDERQAHARRSLRERTGAQGYEDDEQGVELHVSKWVSGTGFRGQARNGDSRACTRNFNRSNVRACQDRTESRTGRPNRQQGGFDHVERFEKAPSVPVSRAPIGSGYSGSRGRRRQNAPVRGRKLRRGKHGSHPHLHQRFAGAGGTAVGLAHGDRRRRQAHAGAGAELEGRSRREILDLQAAARGQVPRRQRDDRRGRAVHADGGIPPTQGQGVPGAAVPQGHQGRAGGGPPHGDGGHGATLAHLSL